MNEPFGPFRPDVDPVERIAQLRVLRTLVHVFATFQEGGPVEVALLGAESDAVAGDTALLFFDDLPTLVKRRVLATFAYIHSPLYNSPREQSRKGTAHAHLE